MTVERYIRIFAGIFILASLALGIEGSPLFVSSWALANLAKMKSSILLWGTAKLLVSNGTCGAAASGGAAKAAVPQKMIRRHHLIVVHEEGLTMGGCRRRLLMGFSSARRQECRRSSKPPGRVGLTVSFMNQPLPIPARRANPSGKCRHARRVPPGLAGPGWRGWPPRVRVRARC